jgi:hypothetical protein
MPFAAMPAQVIGHHIPDGFTGLDRLDAGPAGDLVFLAGIERFALDGRVLDALAVSLGDV